MNKGKLHKISATNDLDFYYNARNVPNQQLVFETIEHFESTRKDLFKPLDFLNLLWKQYNYVAQNFSTPHSTLNTLLELPLTSIQQHILLGFILKWFGGYPIRSFNEQQNSTLKLIEKKFLAYEEETPEKIICAKQPEAGRELDEAAAILATVITDANIKSPNDASRNIYHKYYFSESRYINKVPIDFEDLPKYVIQKGIIWKFEQSSIRNTEELYTWRSDLVNFINSIPIEFQIKTLEKGIEYGNLVYQYHITNECNDTTSCYLNESWERRIALAQSLLTSLCKQQNISEVEENEEINNNKDFTTARQVLALHFIFEQLQVRETEIDRTAKAKLVEFLTGKNYKNVYDALSTPFMTKQRNFRFADLKYIRSFFENLGLNEIVKAINNQLDKPR